jgi:hypothetical protein
MWLILEGSTPAVADPACMIVAIMHAGSAFVTLVDREVHADPHTGITLWARKFQELVWNGRSAGRLVLLHVVLSALLMAALQCTHWPLITHTVRMRACLRPCMHA